MELMLDRRAIEEALAIGQSSFDKERAQFHEPYRALVSRAPIDYIDIVTPFRRVVLAAETRARLGDRRFGQKEALAVLNATPLQLGVYVELTFHPLNTYVGVPDYRVRLISAARAVGEPLTLDRIPRFGPRVEGVPLPYPFPGPPPSLPGRTLPMLGGTVIAVFDASQIDPKGSYVVAVTEAEKEFAKVTVNLERLR
jgi:hypothetical protein